MFRPSYACRIVERKDLNQSGVKFQGYTLLEIVDSSDLGNILRNSQDESFELLKKLTLRMLEASREDTMAGFQPLLSGTVASITGSDLDASSLASVARLSLTVLLQQFDVVNRVL
ncbi:hypothetical protein V1505DRAFT_380321 [Lipomyces doorenjongii]